MINRKIMKKMWWKPDLFMKQYAPQARLIKQNAPQARFID